MANQMHRAISLENKRRRIVREHYELNRPVTPQELRDEIANIKRKRSGNGLDYRDEMLAARLDV